MSSDSDTNLGARAFGLAWPVVVAVILPVLMAAISGAVIPAWQASRIPPMKAPKFSA